MSDPLRGVTWAEKNTELDSLLEQNSILTRVPLDSGLEAEVTQICMAESSYVLKVWNKNSKPDVNRQFKLLQVLYHRGLSVSQPLGWGIDSNKNQVLLTHFDGVPISKVNSSILTELANMLTHIHRSNQYSAAELELFEAIACLRWILLNRITVLPKGRATITRVKNILKSNPHLHEHLL